MRKILRHLLAIANDPQALYIGLTSATSAESAPDKAWAFVTEIDGDEVRRWTFVRSGAKQDFTGQSG